MAPGSPTTVRRLARQEVERFRSLRLRALATDPLAFGSTYARELGYPPERWESWTASGAEGNSVATFVAESERGELVGMAGTFPEGPDHHIWGMWVDPSRRGEGLGGRLLDALLAWLDRSAPRARLVLDVNPDQVSAVRTYLARGFRFTGRKTPLGHDPPATVQEMVREPAAPGPATGSADSPRHRSAVEGTGRGSR